MRWLAIINPASGGGKSAREIRRLINGLAPLTSEYVITEYPGHSAEIIRQAKDIDAFAIAGGDGTVHEAINVLDLNSKSVGIIPYGTGNSLAQNLNIPSWTEGIAACINGRFANIDLVEVSIQHQGGESSQFYSTCTIGLGYPANAVDLCNRWFKNLGRLCYPIGGVVQAFLKNKFTATFAVNGEPAQPEQVTGVFINNTEYAGNFRAFPDALIDDGLFDVMKMSVGALKQNIQNLLVLFERYIYMPVDQFSTGYLHISLDQAQRLMVDGVIISNVVDITFSICPKALTCIHNHKGA